MFISTLWEMLFKIKKGPVIAQLLLSHWERRQTGFLLDWLCLKRWQMKQYVVRLCRDILFQCTRYQRSTVWVQAPKTIIIKWVWEAASIRTVFTFSSPSGRTVLSALIPTLQLYHKLCSEVSFLYKTCNNKADNPMLILLMYCAVLCPRATDSLVGISTFVMWCCISQ